MTGYTKPSEVFLLGLAGGSGSGKTYFASALEKKLGPLSCQLVLQDNFYFDQSSKFDRDGGSVNFDHPDALDFGFLEKCLWDLKERRSTKMPQYDFVTHKRKIDYIDLIPKKIIIVDGILIFHPPGLRRLFDFKIFFDTPEAVRFQRRLERDVRERGRTEEGVRAQFFNQVKPMHDQFVEPSKNYADKIVNEGESIETVISEFCERFK